MAQTTEELITLEEAIQKSYTMKKDTFIWRTKEDIFNCVLAEEYAFNSIGVMWGRYNLSYTCYIAIDPIPYSSENETFFIGSNRDNGYFYNLNALRKAHPRLFNVKGEFRALVTLRS